MKTRFLVVPVLTSLFFVSCTEKPDDTSFSVGDQHAGGIIISLDQTGEHGIVAATSDLNDSHWGYYGISIGSTSAQNGEGLNNTNEIIATGGTVIGTAVYHCVNFVSGGYDDWYLPSLEELNLIYTNRGAVGINTSYWYWSSTESDDSYAWMIEMSNGHYNSQNKGNTGKVRAVRNF